jgi:hypothetical protein
MARAARRQGSSQSRKGHSRRTRSAQLEQLNDHAAGIDVGADAHWVVVPPDRDEQPVPCFGAFTADLDALAAWLRQCQIEPVVMESTGVYVRRITARAISLAERTGSGGNPWVNDSPRGESQRGQQHVVEAERPRSRVWSGSARPVC